jgi:hypothetical protein
MPTWRLWPTDPVFSGTERFSIHIPGLWDLGDIKSFTFKLSTLFDSWGIHREKTRWKPANPLYLFLGRIRALQQEYAFVNGFV